ncbi:MAG: hypothetical protein OXF26_05485 [Alphaproteobacteria bacterium]|nr:hypothetical protein [Alphaproteobacteria bacterium]
MEADLITAWATVGLIAATLAVGLATVIMIGRGIKAMDRSSDERAKDCREAAENLKAWREADQRRHDEAMAKHDATLEALRALIERTAPVDHRAD